MSLFLTTYDNPFDPNTNFDDWQHFDSDKGYNTCNYLAKVLDETDGLNETELDDQTDQAIMHIVETDPRGIYLYVDPLLKKAGPNQTLRTDPKTNTPFVLS